MEPLDQLLDGACLAYRGNDAPERRTAVAALADRDLAAREFLAAVALADAAAVRAHLAAHSDPRALVATAAGPRDWVPLHYLCYSRIQLPDSDALDVLDQLLAHGADPASAFTLWDSRFTALTGVLGEGERGPVACPPHPEARALAERLLDAGADPNDCQGLYNTMFTPDDGWLELLLARGLHAEHRIHWDMGVGPRPRTLDFLLANAVDQGLVRRVELLLAHGASASAVNPYTGRGLYLSARLAGHEAVVERLLEAGLEPPVLAEPELFALACLEGDRDRARDLAPRVNVQDAALLRRAAARGLTAPLTLLAELGADLDQPDEGGITLLHEAALHGRVGVVRLLLEHGVDPERRDARYGATPLGWAQHNGKAAVAELLRSVSRPDPGR